MGLQTTIWVNRFYFIHIRIFIFPYIFSMMRTFSLPPLGAWSLRNPSLFTRLLCLNYTEVIISDEGVKLLADHCRTFISCNCHATCNCKCTTFVSDFHLYYYYGFHVTQVGTVSFRSSLFHTHSLFLNKFRICQINWTIFSSCFLVTNLQISVDTF